FLSRSGTAHARQHRIASGGKASIQAATGHQQQGADQDYGAVSPNVTRIDAAAGQVLDARSQRISLARAVEKSARMEAAVREMVCRRQTECFGKLSGPASRRAASEQGGNHLGRRTGRQTYAHLSAVAS